MSILTLAEIKTEIRTSFGGRADIDSRLNNVVDLSQLRISRLHDFDELRQSASTSTVITANAIDDKIITFPAISQSRIRQIYSIRALDPNGAISSRKLRKVLPKNWDKDIPEPEFYARGPPTHYTVYETNQFELWRVPDIVYTLQMRLSRWPKSAADTGDGNTIDLENVDDLVINLAISYIYHSLGRSDKGKEFFGIYRGLAKEALIEDTTDYDQAMAGISPDQIRTTRGFDDPFVYSTGGDLGET